ncbi:hypothetical protein GCM10017557_27190 [Streptomyces aurantiacus]|uniref:Uncharacterized protein n=1 Tax=Streptomyces aurantiacus TaxID=47760 RepID=A0A7G1P1R5_9ACTN|nr:hypothetical protein GCM10017557_27190 [Streptomyces aurantiacus]
MTRPGGIRSATSRTRSAYSGKASAGWLCSLIRPILHHRTDNVTRRRLCVSLAPKERFGQTVRPRIAP